MRFRFGTALILELEQMQHEQGTCSELTVILVAHVLGCTTTCSSARSERGLGGFNFLVGHAGALGSSRSHPGSTTTYCKVSCAVCRCAQFCAPKLLVNLVALNSRIWACGFSGTVETYVPLA